MGSCSSKPGEVGAMPIAGVGRVEPMDPVVKREVMRRARESGTFATEPDAAWVGSPLPASVNRRVVSRDATKRPAGPDAPTSSSHFGATVAPRTLDYDGSHGRGSFSGAAVHPTPSDGDAPSPDRVEAFSGMSPMPESPAGFGAGRLPWGSIDLTERVPTPTTEYVDTDDDDDDDVTPRSPGGGPLTLRRARELQADKERAHAAAAALGAGPPLPSSSRGDDTARVHVPNTTSAGRPVSREASSGFHPDSFAGSRPQSREWSGGGGGGGGPGRRVTAAEISGAMRGVRAPKGSAAWESSPSPPTEPPRQQPRVVVGKNDEVHREPAVDSSEEFERETDALLSRGAALMEEPAGDAEKGAEEGADTAVHESKPTSPASPERRATPPPAITSDTSPSAASSEDENREPGVDDEIGLPVKPIPSPGIPGIPTEIPTVTELNAQGESLEVPRRASMPPPRRGWIDETEDGADDLELAAAVHSVPPPSVAPLPSPAKTSPAPANAPAVVRPGSAASSRSDFVSKLPAPPLGLLSKSGAKQTTPTNPRSKLKTFDYSKQNGRSPTVISEDKEPADAAADKAALTNAVRPMSQGARVRSTTAAGYKKNSPPGNTQKNTKQPDPADASVATKGTSKKVTYRDRIASGRRAASGGADTAPTEATDTNDGGPVPSVTPAKLKQREEGADATSERVLTKAEEAKNRLRRNRRSSATSASMGAPLGLGPRASDGGASASVSASVPAHPVEAAQALAKPAPKVGLSASELADRLGSVKRVIKPRSSMPDLGRGGGRGVVSDKHAPGEDKQRSADAETSGSVPTSVPDATSTESGVPIVRGLDEAELVLRVDTLANKDALVGARGAVVRMTELLDYVNSTSKALNCEPQNVFGHLLFRCGQPTDRTSQSLRLNDVVDPDVLRRMVSVTAELRGLLRIKVQDNTDLQLAATALRETASFFARLDDAAEKCSMEPWKVLEAQRPSRGKATRGW